MPPSWLVPLAMLAVGCALPRQFAIDDASVARQLDTHFELVFGHSAEVPGLVRPRFGDPALVGSGAAFPITVLQRASASPGAALIEDSASPAQASSCVGPQPDAACVPITLVHATSTAIDSRAALHTYDATPARALPTGCYDLVTGVGTKLERARRAVCVQPAFDPEHELTVVQMSDLHVGRAGKQDEILRRLQAVVAEVNALRPDVVLVTGDLAEQGHEPALEAQSAAVLASIVMPMIVIIGNHDYGHFPKVVHADVPDGGYFNFAHSFHGELFVRKQLACYDLVGFDSGPSIFSMRIMTRGIGEPTLSRVRDAISEDAAAKRGTILFSHAPTRSALSSDPKRAGSNRLGSMAAGGKELEALLLAAGERGERVIHLAGHTHWSDLFFSRPGMSHFERIPFARLTSPVQLDASAILVNAPSATRVTFSTVEHGKAYGYVVLRLRARDTVVQFHLFDEHDRPLAPQ